MTKREIQFVNTPQPSTLNGIEINSQKERDFSHKILSLEDLAEQCARIRAEGKTIAHCHGVFDLLHIGHIRHFKEAGQFGDVMVVTITADEFVNKGPDRPIFTSELRAEFLANLSQIDFVAVVEDSSAAPAIRNVQPDFYVKGGDYSKPEDDVTGKIMLEQQMVEEHGGQLVFTDDITFSSSNLINRHMSRHDKNAQMFLNELRETDLEQRINGYLQKIQSMKVVVIGETIIDQYTYVAPMGKAAKENIIATLFKNKETFAGGVVAAANHLSAFCPNLNLLTMLGSGNVGEDFEPFVRDQLNSDIDLTIIQRTDGPTVKKERFVEPTYVRKLFEVYEMSDGPLPDDVQKEFHEKLKSAVKDADLVVVNDFGHGFMDKAAIEIVQDNAQFLAVNAQSNAGNIGYNLINRYSKADLVCIDFMEAHLAAQDKHASVEELVSVKLPALIDCPNIIVTNGRAGCVASDGNGGTTTIPAFSGTVVDTVGAGDAFFVIASSVLAAGADCSTAAFMGNVAGAISIGIVGHRRYINKLEVQRYVTTLLK